MWRLTVLENTEKNPAGWKGREKTKELKEGLIHTWNNLKRNVDPGETGVSKTSSEIL